MPFDPTTAQPLEAAGFDPTTAQPAETPEAKPASETAARGRAAIEFLNRAHLGPVGLGDVATGAATLANSAALGIPERALHAAGNDTLQGMREAAPTASTIGDVGGMLAGGAGVAKVLTNVVPRLAVRSGEGALRTGAKLLATGAAVGTAQAEASGDDIGPGATAGAVGGVVGGGAANAAGKAALLLRNRGTAVLAKALGQTPQELANAMTSFQQQWGRKPSMLDIVNLRARGAIKQVASQNPEMGAGLADAQAARETALPKGQSGNPEQAMDVVTLRGARDTRMTQAMGDTNDPAALRNQSVTSGMYSTKAADVLDQPNVAKALKGDPELQGLVTEAFDEPTHAPLTVDHFENLRQALRKQQSAEVNTIRAKKIKDVADAVETYAAAKQPAYRAALDTYRSDSNYADAFEHGRAGGDRTKVTDPKLNAALKTTEGQTGYEHGTAEKTAADNLSTAAPSYIKAPSGMTPSDVAHSVMALKTGGAWGTKAYHLARLWPGSEKLPVSAQKQIVQMLTKSNSAPQALRAMAKYGASKATVDRISQALSGGAGVTAAQAVGE